MFDPSAPEPGLLDAGPADEIALLGAGRLDAEHLAALAAKASPIDGPPVFDVPVARPSKILCLGKNYAAHARELGDAVPEEPLFFAKLPESLCAHGQAVHLPAGLAGRVDHEVELCCVLGFPDPGARGARRIRPERAFELVAGYTILNDVTARDLQRRDRDRGWPWLRAKSFDTFCPTGPFVVPRASLAEPPDLEISLAVNGRVRQRARTSEMVVGIAAAIAWLSRHTTLRPGDLVATGTPAGVGPISPGDTMSATIDGLGRLENGVVGEPGSPATDRL